MDKFLVLVKTRQCKVKGVKCLPVETGREQAAPQAHGNQLFFFSLFFFLLFLLTFRANCVPRRGHMYMQVHYVVVLLNNIRTSGFLMKSPYCKKKKRSYQNPQKSRDEGWTLARALRAFFYFFFFSVCLFSCCM